MTAELYPTTPTLIPFEFHSHTLTAVTDDSGEPWFIASEVCAALELDNVSQAVSRLDIDEKNTIILNDGAPGNPSTLIINESGLYSLTLGSRKKIAKDFKRWVTHEVLPQIRKTGRYAPTTRGDLLVQMAEAYRLQERRLVEIEASQQSHQQQFIAQQQDIIALQAQQLEGLRGVASANVKADMAIANQQWLTVRKYVFLHELEHQMPPSVCKAYGTFLTGYCLENGIPVDDQPVADRQWSKENSYHAEVIVKTLPGWLNRQHSQPTLTILPAGGTA